MDFKKLVERIKSSRNFKVIAMAAGVLVFVAAGGAYYFLVYQPQLESEAAAAKQPAARKPQTATAKPAGAQPPTSGVPAAKPASAQPPAPSMPVTAQVPVAAAPMPAKTAQPVKPEPAAEKLKPEKRQVETMPELVDKPAQAAKTDRKADAENLEQARPRSQDAATAVAPESGEAAPVAEAEPSSRRRGITPKYNDILTPVLRGDRDAVKQLLDLGWWVDKPGSDGTTPLMAAVMNRDAPMVQLLLDHGAEPSARALMLARKNKDAATASLLEQKGAH